jgi:hypothetical protein
MSADDGYVIRKNDAGKFVLQHYFMSNEEYPPIGDPRAMRFDTQLEAEKKYDEIDDERVAYGAPIEYGLTIDRSCRE